MAGLSGRGTAAPTVPARARCRADQAGGAERRALRLQRACQCRAPWLCLDSPGGREAHAPVRRPPSRYGRQDENPLNQRVAPEDVAAAVAFLAADDARMITEIDLIVDGGRLIP
ncbi:SDR family oxidoreductase [Cupriavidus lacunae]|uniref:SDR family oxidoreductase n=1 Tax=Cupriavidus lacunae TaxID=2666307 RepID=UPI001ABF57D9